MNDTSVTVQALWGLRCPAWPGDAPGGKTPNPQSISQNARSMLSCKQFFHKIQAEDPLRLIILPAAQHGAAGETDQSGTHRRGRFPGSGWTELCFVSRIACCGWRRHVPMVSDPGRELWPDAWSSTADLPGNSFKTPCPPTIFRLLLLSSLMPPRRGLNGYKKRKSL